MTSARPSNVARTAPVETVADLAAWFQRGAKPKAEWRIGCEHEKLGMQADALAPLPYGGARGIRAMLEGLQQFGWTPILEDGHVIALTRPQALGGGEVSLEPGGQLEYSGPPHANLHETARDGEAHLKEVRQVAQKLGQRYLALGYMPFWKSAEGEAMPKSRYRIMGQFLADKGRRSRDMMFLSAAAQVSLDYASEADMVQKMRTALALQPLATALFANSPFRDGKPGGELSARSLAWTDIDSARTGLLPFVFGEGFGFAAYTEWALDVPMCFLRRGGAYVDVSGQNFRDFLRGALPALPGEKPTMQDWKDHLSVIFPEVRLKQVLEMRGADTGPLPMLWALAAFWVGLFYHQPSLDEASALVADWSVADLQALRLAAPKEALRAAIGGRSLQELAQQVLPLAAAGLRARAAHSADAEDETVYLEPLMQIAQHGRSRAEDWLEAYRTEWDKSLTPLLTHTRL